MTCCRRTRLAGPLLLSCLLLSALPAQAQLFRSTAKVGTTAGQFLKIGAGARALGMGDAQVGSVGDIASVYWNPAALSRMPISGEFTFTHVNWLADVSYDFAAGAMPIGTIGTFGLSFTSLRVPEDIVRTVDFPEGDGRTWDAASLAFGLTYSRNLTDRFSIGFTAKYLRERIWSESASGFAVDIGTLYMSEIPGLNIGASISNFGTTMRLDGRDIDFNYDPDNNVGTGPNNVPSQLQTGGYDLPLTFRIGIAWDIALTEEIRTTLAVDATHPNDNTEYMNSGIEASWREIVFGRIGYKSLFLRDSEQGLTWGVGVHYGVTNGVTFKLDYGFADYGRLKNVQYFSLGVRL